MRVYSPPLAPVWIRVVRAAVLLSIAQWAIAQWAIAPIASASEVYIWKDKDGSIHYSDTEPVDIDKKGVKKARVDGKEIADSAEDEPDKEPESGLGSQRAQARQPRIYSAPLLSSGQSYYVSATLNGALDTKLLLDTGASLTILSESTARSLGVSNFDDLPELPVSTAGGVSSIHLTRLESIKIGQVEARRIEVGISKNLGARLDGLLGANFLNRFRYQVDAASSLLTLQEPYEAGKMHGGVHAGYWKSRYQELASSLRRYELVKRRIESGADLARDRTFAPYAGYTLSSINRVINFYRGLFDELDREAARVGVPRELRSYP